MPLPLRTERLVIRPYRETDATPLHEVFGSPEVMKWTPSAPSKDVAETAQRLARTMAFTARQPPGLGLWALELRDSAEFLGQVGLFPVEGKGPDVEVAYELSPRVWGHGYATEAARALVDYGLTLQGPGRFYNLDLIVYARERTVG